MKKGVVFIQQALARRQLSPHLYLQQSYTKEKEEGGKRMGSALSIYAWTGHEQLLLCRLVTPEATQLSCVSIQGIHMPKLRLWVLVSKGNCNGQTCCVSVPAQSVSVPLHSSTTGINSISLCQRSVSRTETIKVLKLFENCMGTV